MFAQVEDLADCIEMIWISTIADLLFATVCLTTQ